MERSETFLVESLDALPGVAAQIANKLGDSVHVAFYGEMGAGKTTLIKALLKVYGAGEEGSSPTFSLVNEYALPRGNRIFHFDFYRINRIEEVYDMGYEEYFFSGHPCFMEWPEKIEALLPEDTRRIRITVEVNGCRKISLE